MTDIEDQLRHDLMIITERAQPGSIRPLRAPQPRAVGREPAAGHCGPRRNAKVLRHAGAGPAREIDGHSAEVGNRGGAGVGTDHARAAG
jgi:hypothetical protein